MKIACLKEFNQKKASYFFHIATPNLTNQFRSFFEEKLLNSSTLVPEVVLTTFSFGKKSERLSPQAEEKIAILMSIMDTAINIYDDALDGDFIFSEPTTRVMMSVDSVLFSALDALSSIQNYQDVAFIIKCLQKCIHAEVADINMAIHSGLTEDDYFTHIVEKSTNIFKMQMCGYPSTREIFCSIAEKIAVALQVKNDIKNLSGEIKSDIIEKKVTLPLLKAMEYAQDHTFDFHGELEKCSSGGDMSNFLQFLVDSKCLDYSSYVSEYYYNFAIKEISEKLSNYGEEKNELLELFSR